MRESPDLLLGFVPLLAHDIDVVHQSSNAVVQDLSLLLGQVVAGIEFIHLVVVELHISCQIGAPTLEHAYLFVELFILKFECVLAGF